MPSTLLLIQSYSELNTTLPGPPQAVSNATDHGPRSVINARLAGKFFPFPVTAPFLNTTKKLSYASNVIGTTVLPSLTENSGSGLDIPVIGSHSSGIPSFTRKDNSALTKLSCLLATK